MPLIRRFLNKYKTGMSVDRSVSMTQATKSITDIRLTRFGNLTMINEDYTDESAEDGYIPGTIMRRRPKIS